MQWKGARIKYDLDESKQEDNPPCIQKVAVKKVKRRLAKVGRYNNDKLSLIVLFTRTHLFAGEDDNKRGKHSLKILPNRRAHHLLPPGGAFK